MPRFIATIDSYQGQASIRPCYWRGLHYELRNQMNIRDPEEHVFIFQIEQGTHTPQPDEDWGFEYVRHAINGVDKKGNKKVYVTVAPVQRVEEVLPPHLDSARDEWTVETRSGTVVVGRVVHKILRVPMNLIVNGLVQSVRVIVRADLHDPMRKSELPDGILQIQLLGFGGMRPDVYLSNLRKTLGRSCPPNIRALLPPNAPEEIPCV